MHPFKKKKILMIFLSESWLIVCWLLVLCARNNNFFLVRSPWTKFHMKDLKTQNVISKTEFVFIFLSWWSSLWFSVLCHELERLSKKALLEVCDSEPLSCPEKTVPSKCRGDSQNDCLLILLQWNSSLTLQLFHFHTCYNSATCMQSRLCSSHQCDTVCFVVKSGG